MKPFESLTTGGQFRRLRALALRALRAWGLENARLIPLNHGENTTFRVEAPSGRFGLRVARPGYHSDEALESEFAWLRALSDETDITVPRPVAQSDGRHLVVETARGVDAPRRCALFTWVEGRMIGRGPLCPSMRRIGALMADLHNHAERWTPPPGFERLRWSPEGLLGPGETPWGCVDDLTDVDEESKAQLIAARDQTRAALEALGEPEGLSGLIHADLHPWNVLHDRGLAAPIDFDDCGFGHHLHDICVPLNHVRSRPDVVAAFFEGYRSRRALAPAVLEALDAFVMARHINGVAWLQSRSDNPKLAEHLPKGVERTLALFARYGTDPLVDLSAVR